MILPRMVIFFGYQDKNGQVLVIFEEVEVLTLTGLLGVRAAEESANSRLSISFSPDVDGCCLCSANMRSTSAAAREWTEG
jgi:hypothetical protein